jgi:N-acetylmuramoyl-L-alanine amidase
MRWTRTAITALLLLLPGTAQERRVSIYSQQTSYSLTTLERDGRDYVGLLETLEPLGHVGAAASGKKWKLRFNQVEAEFTDGASRARIRGRDCDLPAPFRLENGRGLVPVASLATLLPLFTGTPISFHEAARRLFLGSAAVRYTAELVKGTPSRLVLRFTSPVNPNIATEPDKLHMIFTHEPLVPPGSQNLTFDDKTITAATYQEANGNAEITVLSAIPLLASFSNENRTITLAPAPSAATPALSPAQAPPPVAGPAPTPAPGTAPAAAPGAPLLVGGRRFFAVIDASHGGDERGAALSDKLAEKDVVLALARQLQRELQIRGVSALLLRDSDATLTLDQRASLANSVRPALYIAIHASAQSNGAWVYTALLPAGGDPLGPFEPWETAQLSFLPASQVAAASVASELRKHQVPARTLPAPLRPLNNLNVPAIAVEVTPPGSNAYELNSAEYQQSVVAGIVEGLLAVRARLEALR